MRNSGLKGTMGFFDLFKTQPKTKVSRPTTIPAAPNSAAPSRDDIRQGMIAFSVGDVETAVKIFRPLAELGDAEGQFRLAFICKVVLQDYDVAADWYRKAADQGHAEAQAKLGFLYRSGRGVPKDFEQGAMLYEKSANQGFVEAQYNLARCYLAGEGVRKDVVAAVGWFTRAAKAGYADAEYTLGILYSDGSDVPRDMQKAFYWLTRVADKAVVQPLTVGDILAPANDARNAGINALWNLGHFYRQGNLVAKDERRAFTYYLKAAQLGDAASQHAVGVCYLEGTGISPDSNMGIEYIRKAALQGYERAQQALNELGQRRG